jgi:hypothetical protein
VLAAFLRLSGPPVHYRYAFLVLGWSALVIGGVRCRDVLLIIITVRCMILSLGAWVMLWRSSEFPRTPAANFFYWAGVISVMFGAVHFGVMALNSSAFDWVRMRTRKRRNLAETWLSGHYLQPFCAMG